MLMVILSMIVAIVLFLCAFLGFKEGLRIGMQTSKGVEPPKLNNPIEIVKEIKKEHEQTLREKEQIKADKIFNEKMDRMMNYTGGDEDEDNR